MINLKAVILAAGEGRRCRPLTQTRSKVMLPVGNMPFLEHVIRALAANQVTDLTVVVGYRKERVMNHFQDGLHYGVNIRYVVQEELLGTTHALSKVPDLSDQDFLVVNGDNLLDARAVSELISAPGEYVILAALRRDSGEYGVITAEGDRVVSIAEKPGRRCAGILNTGAYRFKGDIFQELSQTPISERGSYELTMTLSQMIEKGMNVRVCITQGTWADAIFAWDLLEANSLAMGLRPLQRKGTLESGVEMLGDIEVGPGTVIRSGCYIVGPVVIGKNCDVGPHAVILPSSTLCDSVKVGAGSEIRNSILMNGSRIGSGCVLSDSVLGSGCSLGDQVVMESGESLVEVEDQCHRAEFGAVMADNVVVGSRAFMYPGTIVGTDSRIGPTAMLRGVVERGSRVI